jgi:hypothetical protein
MVWRPRRRALIGMALVLAGFLVGSFAAGPWPVATKLSVILAAVVVVAVLWTAATSNSFLWSILSGGAFSRGLLSLPDALQSPADADPTIVSAVRKAVQGLAVGNVAVDAPAKMTVGETRQVQVTIGLGTREDFLAGFNTARESLQLDQTKVGDVMRVELLGGEAIAITPIGDAERIFLDRQTWQFEVTAKLAGKAQLTVLVAVLLQLPGRSKEQPYYAPVKQLEIQVRVDYLRTIGAALVKSGRAAMLSLGGAVLGFIFELDPVKAAMIHGFNRVIGDHIGLHLPED